MTYTVYAIKNNKGKLYKGVTTDLDKRLKYHNQGLSKWTRNQGPWLLVYREKYKDKTEAFKRERFLKSGKGRDLLKQLTSGCGAVG